jgi:hypothetical protein
MNQTANPDSLRRLGDFEIVREIGRGGMGTDSRTSVLAVLLAPSDRIVLRGEQVTAVHCKLTGRFFESLAGRGSEPGTKKTDPGVNRPVWK